MEESNPLMTRLSFGEPGVAGLELTVPRLLARTGMPDTTSAYVAVTFSPQASVAYFLRGVLESAGFAVSAASFCPNDLQRVVMRTRPDVIVYDLSFPFNENWHQFQELKHRPSIHNIPVVITTSEARELYRTVGVSAAVELFKRPDDVTELRAAVRCAIEAATPVHAA